MSRKPYVTVLVELEDWDDTTDAIVWLIEEKFNDVIGADLTIDKSPYGWSGIENLEKQSGRLEGWKDRQRTVLYFEAEYAEIPMGKDEQGEEIYQEGYKITVHDVRYPAKKTEYVIFGTHRKDFELVEGEKRDEKI